MMSHIKSGRWWLVIVLLLAGVIVCECWVSTPPVTAQEGRQTLPALEDREARRRAIEELGRSGDERQVAPLVEALRGDRDFLVRSAAAEALGNLKSELGLPALIAALDDASPDVRAAAALALARLGKPQGNPALRRRLRDLEPIVRSAAAQALGKLGDGQALPDLINCLADAEPEVRTSAAEALGALGRREAVEPLLRTLGDSNMYVRSRAAMALGTLGDPRAVPAVSELLLDKERTVRASAAEALGRFRDRQAVLPLLDALRDREAVVRQNAAFALGKIGDETAADGLVDALRDEDARVRARAVDALGALAVPRTLDAIVDSLRDGDALVRTMAVQALGNFKDERATAALVQTLAADDALLRRRAVESLAKIGDPSTLPAVQTALGDANPAVRASAVAALPRIGGNQALPVLLTAFQSPDTTLQSAAAFALARLGSEEAFVGVVEAIGQMTFDDVLNRRAAIGGFFSTVTESQPRLKGLLQSPNTLQRRGAVLGLMVVAVPPAATNTFLEALADSDLEVRRAALAALARTDPARLAQATAERLPAEPNPTVRLEWLSLLPKLQEISPALAETLRQLARQDAVSDVRQAAVAALDRLRLPQIILPSPPRMLPAIANIAPPSVPDLVFSPVRPLPPAPSPSALVAASPAIVVGTPDMPYATAESLLPPELPTAAVSANVQPGEAPPSGSIEAAAQPPTATTASTLPTLTSSPTLQTVPAIRPTVQSATEYTPSLAVITARSLPLRKATEARAASTWLSLGMKLPAGSSAPTDLIARNEAQIISLLERLVAAQLDFRTASGGSFATLAQIREQAHDLETLFAGQQDYVVSMYVTEATAFGPADFFVLAVPRIPGLTGQRAFYVDASGIIRSSEVGQPSLPAARQWTPIREQSAG